MPRIRPRVFAATVLAGLLAFNAVATLYAAATAPTITACVKSSGAQKGLMRYSSSGSCGSGETKVAWNVTGPTGPQGPAGSGGAGAMPVYKSDLVPPPVSGGSSDLTLDLPAGTYLVSLNVYSGLDIPGSGTVNDALPMTCTIKDTTYATWVWVGSGGTIALDTFETLTARTTYKVRCTWYAASRLATAQWTVKGTIYATPVVMQ